MVSAYGLGPTRSTFAHGALGARTPKVSPMEIPSKLVRDPPLGPHEGRSRKGCMFQFLESVLHHHA